MVLDRDGTINVEHHYLSSADRLELLPNAAEGIVRFRELGLKVIIITNQSGVNRGYFDRSTLREIHNRLKNLLALYGAKIDGIYVCPHRPEEKCDCRKPKIALLEKAAGKLGLKPADAFVIGDNTCDIEMGHRAGATTFLVTTGYGKRTLEEGKVKPHYIVSDLKEAAQIISQIISGQGG